MGLAALDRKSVALSLLSPDRKELPALKPCPGGVYSLAYSADGNTVATGGGDKIVRLWDVGQGRERAVMQGHTARVVCVAL